jgi:DNA-binding FadR family transcriptional regulator
VAAGGDVTTGTSSAENSKRAEVTAARIEQDIINAGWPIGRVLGAEPDLLLRYGVSRGVLREAVRLLEHHGVARMRAGVGGGLVVTRPGPEAVTDAAAVYLQYENVDYEQLYDARLAVELFAVEKVARDVGDEQIAELRGYLDIERAAVSGGAQSTTHEFHVMVGRMTGNPAISMFTQCLTVLTQRQRRDLYSPAALLATHQAHTAIAEAIIAADPAVARYRMLRHLQAMSSAWPRDDEKISTRVSKALLLRPSQSSDGY